MDQTEDARARQLAAYSHNWEMFRSLNSLMWQIPVIAMTLIGGLWFGASKSETAPLFQVCLLLLAVVGAVGLALILDRLRYIMEQYLRWLRAFEPAGFVEAPGEGWKTRALTVRRVFQFLLAVTAGLSLLLMLASARQLGIIPKMASTDSVAYYDRQARDLADAYEGLSFEQAHPALLPFVSNKASLRVLDVGSGTGRDAAWLAGAGHIVTAVEPSGTMLKLARKLHGDAKVRWIQAALPSLDGLGDTDGYDLVVLSAVWMHVAPSDRPAAMARLAELSAPNGRIYVTLRTGPTAPERLMYPASAEELRRLAADHGLIIQDLGESPDLLNRPGVAWQVIMLTFGQAC